MVYDYTKLVQSNREGKEDKGIVPGLLRGYCVEFEKNGEKSFASCVYAPGTLLEYLEADKCNSYSGDDPFEMCHMNGWTETGRVEFCGYVESYYDDWDGKWEEYLRDIDINEYLAKQTKVSEVEKEVDFDEDGYPIGFWEAFEEEREKLGPLPDADADFEAYRMASARFKKDLTKTCTNCGCKTQWEHPSVSGMFMQSSEYEEHSDLCHSCLVEHCCGTNCLECKIGKYPNCPHMDLKKHYMEEEA